MASSTIKTTYLGYAGITVSVPNDSAPHQIYALMAAIDPKAPKHTQYLAIQNHPLVSTANALIGESALDDQGATNPSKLTSSNCGVVLLPADSETFGGWHDEYNNITRLWVINDGSGTGVLSLNVTCMRG